MWETSTHLHGPLCGAEAQYALHLRALGRNHFEEQSIILVPFTRTFAALVTRVFGTEHSLPIDFQ